MSFITETQICMSKAQGLKSFKIMLTEIGIYVNCTILKMNQINLVNIL